MIETSHRSSGFDYLRLVLATAVIAEHSRTICYGNAAIGIGWAGPLRFGLNFILPGFFCLSGFLVAGSLFRVKKASTFLCLRAARILPALFAEVVLSACLIGPLLTYDNLQTYFSSSQFYSYFLNIVGGIHFFLPGVFINNPLQKVNAQLWTIPYEMGCYIAIIVFYAAGLLNRRPVFLFCVIGATAIVYVHLAISGTMPGEFGATSSRSLEISFFAGTLIFLYRDKIPLSSGIFFFSLSLYIALMMFPGCMYLVPFPVGYMTIYLGLLNPRKVWFLSSGDYSYGLYLYGYPVQQAICQLLPQFRFWYVNLALSLFFAGLIAFCSWTLLESRVLNRKQHIISYVNLNLARITALLYRVA
jgi:peptidoglycan/LPS O-acetylase OafA/YrhL